MERRFRRDLHHSAKKGSAPPGYPEHTHGHHDPQDPHYRGIDSPGHEEIRLLIDKNGHLVGEVRNTDNHNVAAGGNAAANARGEDGEDGEDEDGRDANDPEDLLLGPYISEEEKQDWPRSGH